MIDTPFDTWAGWWQYSAEAAYLRIVLAWLLAFLFWLFIGLPIIDSMKQREAVKLRVTALIGGVWLAMLSWLTVRRVKQLQEDEAIRKEEESK